ncbi:MAG TPA: hypothetical protein VN450_07575, partial [Candidatus Methylomirabilis sp.]|nr:hypothetical protein [Candidatus Methylomirabilis sp.]
FLAIALVLSTGLAAVSMWGIVHARRMGVSSSQILLHGTPVCITQRGGEIEAAIGECGSSPGASEGEDGGFHGTPHPFGNPNAGLPPGHPPVGSDPDLAETEVRRTPI